jgi:exosome complex RNA-binding protein Rrp42 (RNase PH superfamily)
MLISSRVVVRISADVVAPPPERKFDGVFQIITEFSPMASPAFEIGRFVPSRFGQQASSRKHLTDAF